MCRSSTPNLKPTRRNSALANIVIDTPDTLITRTNEQLVPCCRGPSTYRDEHTHSTALSCESVAVRTLCGAFGYIIGHIETTASLYVPCLRECERDGSRELGFSVGSPVIMRVSHNAINEPQSIFAQSLGLCSKALQETPLLHTHKKCNIRDNSLHVRFESGPWPKWTSTAHMHLEIELEIIYMKHTHTATWAPRQSLVPRLTRSLILAVIEFLFSEETDLSYVSPGARASEQVKRTTLPAAHKYATLAPHAFRWRTWRTPVHI